MCKKAHLHVCIREQTTHARKHNKRELLWLPIPIFSSFSFLCGIQMLIERKSTKRCVIMCVSVSVNSLANGFKSISHRSPTHACIYLWMFHVACVCVCVCVAVTALCDAELEGSGSAREVIHFYLLWRFNCNFTSKRAHANSLSLLHTHAHAHAGSTHGKFFQMLLLFTPTTQAEAITCMMLKTNSFIW